MIFLVDLLKKTNKIRLKKLFLKNVFFPQTLQEDNTDISVASFMDLIRTPKMRKHTFILSFNWYVWEPQHMSELQNTGLCVWDVFLSYRFTSAVVYQGLVMRLGILGGNVYIDFLISGIVEFPAALLILFTIDRVGRRLPFATANIVSGAACLITAFIPESK